MSAKKKPLDQLSPKELEKLPLEERMAFHQMLRRKAELAAERAARRREFLAEQEKWERLRKYHLYEDV